MKGVFLLFLIFLQTQGYSFSEARYKACLEEQAKDFIKKNNSAGLAIAVYKEALDLEKPYEKMFCFGQARRSRKMQVLESTIFRLGSLSKLFTVLVLLKYEKEGRLKLEEGVHKYFPKTFVFPAYQSTTPTLKQLVLELSGLPCFPTLPLKTSNISEIDVRNFFKNYKLSRQPGKKYEPSDLGYSCLNYLLGRMDKTSYIQIVDKELLKPLDMQDTALDISCSKAYRLAVGHKGIAEVADHVFQKDGSFFKSTLGWSSSIDDMQKLLRFLLSKNSMLSALYKADYVFEDNTFNKLSLGWKITPLSTERQIPLYFQHVSYQGYDHFIGVLPESREGIVILSNSSYSVIELAKKLLVELGK